MRSTWLDLRHQVRPFDVGERNLHGVDTGLTGLAVLLDRVQVKGDAFSARGGQTTLPVAVVAQGLKGLNLDQTALKPLKILASAELAIQARGAGFERVFITRDQVLDVQQYPKVAAERGAIFMCDAGKLIRAKRAFNQALRQLDHALAGRQGRLQFRPFHGILLEVDAEGAL